MTAILQALNGRRLRSVLLVAFALVMCGSRSWSQCAAGVSNYADVTEEDADNDAFGGELLNVDQAVCIYYDPETGIDGWATTTNNTYEMYSSQYPDLEDDYQWVYGVGAQAVLAARTAAYAYPTVSDSGMVDGSIDDTGGQPATATLNYPPPYPGPVYYQLTGYYDQCGQQPGYYEMYSCTQNQYFGGTPGQGPTVGLSLPFATPTALSVSASPNPVAPGQTVTVTTLISTGGNGTPTINAGTITPISTTNLVPYSQQFDQASIWGGYCGSTSNMTVNTGDVPAPDGTSTATKFVSPLSTYCGSGGSYGIYTPQPIGLVAGQTYTQSLWLRGASGGEVVVLSLNDCIGTTITLTSSWQRYTETYPAISSDVTSCSDGSRGFQVKTGTPDQAWTFYMWGAQLEQSSTVGPYVATGASPRTGSGGMEAYTTSFSTPGLNEIIGEYPGDGTYSASGPVYATVMVNKYTPTVSVNCYPNPLISGTAATTCTASVSNGATGNVHFSWNNNPWVDAVLSSGSASESGFVGFPAGNYTVAVSYDGDDNNNATSGSTVLAILPPAVMNLSCNPSVVTGGSNTTCTATVPAGDGTVSFYSSASLTGKWWNGNFPAGGGDLPGEPIAITHDGTIDYNLAQETWPSTTAKPADIVYDSFYARWTGTFVSPKDGIYVIGVNAAGGANIYVNGALIVNQLSALEHSESNLTIGNLFGEITLTAGTTNSIVVEYQVSGNQYIGPIGIQLLWEVPGTYNTTLLGWDVVPVDGGGHASITGGSAWNGGSYNVSAVYSGDTYYPSLSASTAVFVRPQPPPFNHRRAVTIDHSFVVNSDQTDFPVLVSGTYAYLKAVSNGGMVQNPNGYDIIFTSDPDGQVPLDYEIDSYNASTGKAAFWVRIPALSHTVDTTIYMWYGNPAVTTSQENKGGVLVQSISVGLSLRKRNNARNLGFS